MSVTFKESKRSFMGNQSGKPYHTYSKAPKQVQLLPSDADSQPDLQKLAAQRWMNQTMNHSPRISPPFESHGKGAQRAFTSQNSPLAHSMIDAARE